MLSGWLGCMGFIFVAVRGKVCTINSTRYGVNYISCEVFYLFFNLFFMFLFCFDANVCRCYVSFYVGCFSWSIGLTQWGCCKIISASTKKDFFLLIKFGILRILLATLLLWLSWLGNIEVGIVVYTCSSGFLGKLVVIWYTFLVNIGGLLRESGCMLLIVGDLGFTD